ncbi:hypothetical protein LI148_12140 [Colidextribacter sp. 210702-DFI.3.9]|nr:hypothetical protein [Colidextribacter sp. 210702-DFI.3.9]
MVNQTKKGCDYVYLSLKQHDLFRTLLMGFEVPFRSYIADVVISHYPTYIDFSAELNNRKATLSSADPIFLRDKLPNSCYVEIESIDRYIKLKGRDGASEGQTLSIAYCFLGTLFEDSELEFPFIIDSPTGKMDFEKRQAVADIIPLVFNQMIAFVQSAEVERFADRFYANPDSQYLTVVASPQDQAVVVYEGIDFFDSYQREHKGDEK